MTQPSPSIRRPTRRTVLIGAAGAAAASLVASRQAFVSNADAQGLQSRTRTGMAFITPVFVSVAGPDAAALDQAVHAAFATIRAVERAGSLYRDDSEIVALNRNGRITNPSPHLLTMVRHAVRLSAQSDGAFDPTVQPLWAIWADHTKRGDRPSEALLRDALRRVDWRGIEVDDGSIVFDRPGMAVTLNSLTLGHTADAVIATLASLGIDHAFVETGEFGARGHHQDGRAWRLGVVDPREPGTLAYTIDPFRRFAATAGDYKTFFSPDYVDHHIFDPKTGFSPPDWSAITVTGPSGMQADGLSTALFVLDRAGGERLLALNPGVAARYFAKDGSDIGPVG